MLMRPPHDAVITDDERAYMAKEIRRTVAGIARKKFQRDPLVVPDASLATSKISSAYKRHGLILEKALLTALNTRGDVQAWTAKIRVPIRTRPIQVDLITFHTTTRTVTAYEIKRGFGNHDTEARFAIEQRLTAILGVLQAHAVSRHLSPAVEGVAAVGYYGQLGPRIGPHRVIAAAGFPSEFGPATAAFVEAVNDYFRHCLLRQTAPHFIRALHQMTEMEAFRSTIGPPASFGSEFLSGMEMALHPWDALG
jgi:hypothetical protein